MASTPRGSPPMYFPGELTPSDFVNCAALVDVAYDQYTQWVNEGYPRRQNFIWTTPDNGYTYSGPLFWSHWWGEDYDEPFGFAASDANSNAYLVFRGSMGYADDDQDLKIDQVPYAIVPNYGQVHRGFHEIYLKLQPDIYNAIAGLPSFKRFFFTGHSLGSGLSSLAVPDVITNTSVKPSKEIVVLHYNFASPRVGDPQFTYMMNKSDVPTYRIVNTEDLIPDAPPSVSGSYLYKHIGTPIDFTAQYDTTEDNHALDIAYEYAIAHPNDPEGPLPPLRRGLSRHPGVRVEVQGGRLVRLARAKAGAA
jgi:triacylglycerol lipase